MPARWRWPEGRTWRVLAAAAAVGAGVSLAAAPARAQPKNESTWDMIKRTGQVRMGVFEY